MNKDHIKTLASEAVKKSITEKKQSLQRNTLIITDNIITIYMYKYVKSFFWAHCYCKDKGPLYEL